MGMKFVMFPSGVAFFSEVVRHDDFRVQNITGSEERPIAAGYLGYDLPKGTLESLSLSGKSLNVGLNCSTVYPDWKERFLASGICPEVKEYSLHRVKAFFFAFSQIKNFYAVGVGHTLSCELSSVEDLVKELQKG
jgi:hypothetical protein